MTYAAFYFPPLAPIAVVLGAVLLCLVAPVFAMAALGVLVLVAAALLLALAAAVASAPFLLVRSVRRRLRSRRRPEPERARVRPPAARDDSRAVLEAR
ncbi:MAG: hypothetical protein EDQ89_11790 [Acidobacteria bacterium]|nr:MAG: hypothetical protein EDQ89_11790 [Acidobacteriota bacterium]MCL4286225.1 hypothetical protein [Thermoleophilia bacterium]